MKRTLKEWRPLIITVATPAAYLVAVLFCGWRIWWTPALPGIPPIPIPIP